MYRRQFFLGPNYVDNLPNWIKTKVGSNHFITSHPDLELICCEDKNIKLILLGFILDPDNPLYGNAEILNDLLSKNQSFDAIVENTEKYSGRWILIHILKDDIRLFTDACGARSIFYHFTENTTWCSSQPHSIAELLGIGKRDNRDLLEFINSKEFDKNERTLFGDDTLFKGIYHLLPNHYLSVSEKHVRRYWPKKVSEAMTVEQAIKIVAPILKGLYRAANNRFRLIQPVTAGRDTRLLLAASKDVSRNIFYFIQKFKELSIFSKDIRLPRKLLKYLKLNFHVEKCKEYDENFDKYLRKNVYMLQSDHKKVLYFNFFKNFQGYINVSGNYTGIYRPFNWQVFAKPGTSLLRRTPGIGYRKFKYSVDYIDNWEKFFNSDLANYNYPITDMFYWENKAANWVSMFLNELDIAIEEWCPINNRKILSTILSVDSALRIKEDFATKIIEYLWKDTLHEPLAKVGEDNPYKIPYKKILYKLLKRVGLLNFVKKSYYNRIKN